MNTFSKFLCSMVLLTAVHQVYAYDFTIKMDSFYPGIGQPRTRINILDNATVRQLRDAALEAWGIGQDHQSRDLYEKFDIAAGKVPLDDLGAVVSSYGIPNDAVITFSQPLGGL